MADGQEDRVLDVETFQSLPSEDVARLVRAAGPKVGVLTTNGTRRWIVVEHPEEAASDFVDAYFRLGGARFIEILKLFFDHGVDTMLSPIFGPDLLDRGNEYMQLAVHGLLWFAQNPVYLDFYDEYDVRVRVYGDARRYLENSPYAHVLEVFDELAQRTTAHGRHRLFFGVCAHDATETVGEIAVQFFQKHGKLPDRRQIVEAYYGEYVDPVSFFVGFERPSAFDMPLLATGTEDLYFTVSPSLYLDTYTLRAILYDHLYARRIGEASYEELSSDDWQTLARFYAANRRNVLGLGRRHVGGRCWIPLPQVNLSPLDGVDGKEC